MHDHHVEHQVVECVQREISAAIEARQWRGSFIGRAAALISGQRVFSRTLRALDLEGTQQGVPRERIDETLQLARIAHRTAIAAAHYEDLRALLASWRYVHRWVALLMVLLLVVHVAYALAYGNFASGAP